MDIKDRIKKISQYFKGMQVTSIENGAQVIYVIVSFPHGWVIDEDLEKKFDISIMKNGNEYYFCTDIDSGEQKLFDAIDYNIDKMKEAIERAQLLSKKTTELKRLFEDENITIEELRTLEFKYDKNFMNTLTPITTKSSKKEKNKEEKTEIEDE